MVGHEAVRKDCKSLESSGDPNLIQRAAHNRRVFEEACSMDRAKRQ